MKSLKFCSILLALCVIFTLFAAPTAQALADPEVKAEAIYLIDTKTQQVLYSKNAEKSMDPGQLTRMVTVLLTIDAIDNGTISRYDAVVVPKDFDNDLDDDAIRCGLVAGETVTIESLLYCVMLEQAEDACNVLAASVAGSIPEFVKQMNDYAEKLGCTSTVFSSPSHNAGENHDTAAKDAALLVQSALSHALFQEIAMTELYDLPETDKNSSRTLLGDTSLTSSMDPNYYAYTKFFTASIDGTCIFATAARDDLSLLVIVFGTEEGECYSAAATLFDWVFNHFQYSNVLTTKTIIAKEAVSMASNNETVELCPSDPIALLIPNNETMDFDVQYTYYDEQLTAPISAGAVLGEVNVLHDGIVYGTTKLVAANAVSRSQTQYLRAQLFSTLFRPSVLIIIALVLILLTLYILSVIHYRKNRRAYLRYQTAMAAAIENPPEESAIPVQSVAKADIEARTEEELSHLYPETESVSDMHAEPVSSLEKSRSESNMEAYVQAAPSTEFDKVPKQDLDNLNDLFKDL